MIDAADARHAARGDFAIAAIQPREPLDETETPTMHQQAWASAEEAAAAGARLLVLPEYFNVMGLPPATAVMQAGQTERFHAMAREFCLKHSCWLVLPLIEQRDNCCFNTAHLYSPAGSCVFSYDKTHITEAERQLYGLTAGDRLEVFDAPFGTVGIMICYDVYFPEVARTLALKGAHILILPSLQRSDTPERCMLLCRARAVDSQAFFVRSSYGQPVAPGDDRARRCYGRSCIVAPDGAVLANAGPDGTTAIAKVAPRWQWSRPTSGGMPPKPVRSFLEADRRTDLYEPITD